MSLEAWGDDGIDGPEGYVTEEAYAEIEQERDRLPSGRRLDRSGIREARNARKG